MKPIEMSLEERLQKLNKGSATDFRAMLVRMKKDDKSEQEISEASDAYLKKRGIGKYKIR